MSATPLIFLIAGEPSGDLLGARLMAALKRLSGGGVRFAGVGGPQMAAEGLDSLFPIDDLAVMGIVEVLPRLPTFFRRLRQTVAAARAAGPAVLVTIDAPSFSLEVSQRLRGSGVPLVHYVAPSVWAWKPWRAKQMAGYLDHLLALLPFEPQYFERHGLATSFVGHPAIETFAQAGDGEGFRRRHGLPAQAPLLCVLPGGRRGEVVRLSGVFGATAARLRPWNRGLQAVVPTVAGVEEEVRRQVSNWSLPTLVVRGEVEKRDAFAAASAALAASGTVAVELAAAGLPAVIGYRVNPLTAALARRLLQIRYVSIPNLVLDRALMPELLQEACRPERLAAALRPLLRDGPERRAMLAGYREAVVLLRGPEDKPSEAAAQVVLGQIAT